MKVSVLKFIVGAVMAGSLLGQQAEAGVSEANSKSAQEFKRQMYNTDIFTGENFRLTPYTTPFQLEIIPGSPMCDALIKKQLERTVYDVCMARVSKNAAIVGIGKLLTTQHCERAVTQVKGMSLQRFVQSDAANALAEWVFRVDGDNWYAYNSLLRETTNYLAKRDRELFVLRGFSPYNVLVDTLSTEDLPIVLDLAEGTVTLWTLELAD